MELPDKKTYPTYYTIISKPVCIKQILVSRTTSRRPCLTFSQAKLKRHEYKTSGAWAADVDRIFSNAQNFNEDGSIVYNQATALQVRLNAGFALKFNCAIQTHFNQLLSEFPPEHKVERPKVKMGRPKKEPQIKAEPTLLVVPPPQRSLRGRPSEGSALKPVETIKFKLEPDSKPSPTLAPKPIPSRQHSGTPAAVGTPAATKPTPAGPTVVAPTTVSTRATSQAAQNQRPPLPIYQPPVVPSRSSGYPPRTLPPGPPVQASYALGSNNVLPEGIPHNPMTLVTLKTLPIGRMIYLDALDGVSTWSIRLAGGTRESAVSIEGIEVEPDEEEGEEEDAAVKTRNKRATRSALTNGNGYPKAKISDKYLRELQVKLNGRPITPEVEGDDPLARQWTVELGAGGSVLDIGAWRVFLDRD
jgi:chromatin structure-remodeling complex subunit RSC4